MSSENPFAVNEKTDGGAYPPNQPSGGRNTWLIVLVAVFIGFPILFICCGLVAGLTLPAVQAAREAARRVQCSNNLRMIGLAMMNYQSIHGSLPPAYTVDDQGRKLHSWRTLLLPYLDQQPLYEKIDLSKPWDDPANQFAMETPLPVYQCPSAPLEMGMTVYLAVLDPRGAMTGSVPTTLEEIDQADGVSFTLLLTEAAWEHAVPWMSPDDLDIDQFLQTAGPAGKTQHPGGAHVLNADGSVVFIGEEADDPILRSMVYRDDGAS